MNAYNESRQRVFATVSVKFVAVKYILAAARAKFTAMRIFRIKGPGVQPESTRCSENTARCSELEHENPWIYKRSQQPF